MADPHDLQRFVTAQAASYDAALDEIRAGAKRSHWMWWIFPQLAGLGLSPTAQRYAIASLDEARAYLDHPLLGRRYLDCVAALPAGEGLTAEGVFGDVDAMKLRSSLTLFVEAGGPSEIAAALQRWFAEPDAATLRLLGRGQGSL